MAKKKSQPDTRDASYSPEGRTICTACWSALDVSERHEQGRDTVVTDLPWEIDGERHTLAYTSYMCCNPECHVVTWAWKISGMLGRESVAPFRELRTLRGADARKYNAGRTRRGVWGSPTSSPTPTPHGGAQVQKEVRVEVPDARAAQAPANGSRAQAPATTRRRSPQRGKRRGAR